MLALPLEGTMNPWDGMSGYSLGSTLSKLVKMEDPTDVPDREDVMEFERVRSRAKMLMGRLSVVASYNFAFLVYPSFASVSPSTSLVMIRLEVLVRLAWSPESLERYPSLPVLKDGTGEPRLPFDCTSLGTPSAPRRGGKAEKGLTGGTSSPGEKEAPPYADALVGLGTWSVEPYPRAA